MKHVLALVAAPVLAVSMFSLSLTYASPSELWAAVQPVDRDLKVIHAGGSSVEAVVSDIAKQLPQPVSQRTDANADCFADLALADEHKLDRCARVVYQALIDVDKTYQEPVLADAMNDPDKDRIVEQLRYAATNVCRDYWSKKPVDKTLTDSPACKVGQIQIASESP